MRVQKGNFDGHVAIHCTVGIQKFVNNVSVVGTSIVTKKIFTQLNKTWY